MLIGETQAGLDDVNSRLLRVLSAVEQGSTSNRSFSARREEALKWASINREDLQDWMDLVGATTSRSFYGWYRLQKSSKNDREWGGNRWMSQPRSPGRAMPAEGPLTRLLG